METIIIFTGAFIFSVCVARAAIEILLILEKAIRK